MKLRFCNGRGAFGCRRGAAHALREGATPGQFRVEGRYCNSRTCEDCLLAKAYEDAHLYTVLFLEAQEVYHVAWLPDAAVKSAVNYATDHGGGALAVPQGGGHRVVIATHFAPVSCRRFHPRPLHEEWWQEDHDLPAYLDHLFRSIPPHRRLQPAGTLRRAMEQLAFDRKVDLAEWKEHREEREDEADSYIRIDKPRAFAQVVLDEGRIDRAAVDLGDPDSPEFIGLVERAGLNRQQALPADRLARIRRREERRRAGAGELPLEQHRRRFAAGPEEARVIVGTPEAERALLAELRRSEMSDKVPWPPHREG